MKAEVRQRIEQIQCGKLPCDFTHSKAGIHPIGWHSIPLSNIAQIGQGFTFKREYQGSQEGRWNYFKVADIGLPSSSKYLINAQNRISDAIATKIGCTPFPAGSIVFPRVGAALFNNNKRMLMYDSIVDDNVLVLTCTEPDTCDKEYLYYALAGIELAEWCNSGLVPVINSKTVLKQYVKIPPVAEQRKIAAILTTQDKVIELKEKLLAEKQRQKKHLMQQLLTGKKRLPGVEGEWHWESFEKVFTFGSTNTFSRDCLNDGGQGVRNLHYGDVLIRFGEILNVHHTTLPVIKPDIEQKNVCLVENGDVVIADTAEDYTVGKATEVRGIVSEQVVSGLHTMLCKPHQRIFSPGWLGYFLNSPGFHRQLLPYIAGVKVQSISKSNIVKTQIAIPSAEEQAAIASILSTADREIALLQESITAEKAKKKALMQLLLTGIVRVTP